MVSFDIQIGSDISALLKFPKDNIQRMFNIGKVVGRFDMLQDSVKQNFQNRKNIDGSTWAPWSDYTNKLRARGILRVNPLVRGKGSLMQGTGEYYNRMAKDLLGFTSSVDMKDDIYGEAGAVYKFAVSRTPQLRNEYDYKELHNKNVTPKRQVMFWNDKAIDNILKLVTEQIDGYWRT